MIEDQKADEIIVTIRGLLKSFKIKTYDEDTQYGLLRHVLIRHGFSTGEIMVVLVTASPVFPSKNNFVKACEKFIRRLRRSFRISTTGEPAWYLEHETSFSMEKDLSKIKLCGCTFRISAQSFYQVNPVQTEILYQKAIEAAGLTGKENRARCVLWDRHDRSDCSIKGKTGDRRRT